MTPDAEESLVKGVAIIILLASTTFVLCVCGAAIMRWLFW